MKVEREVSRDLSMAAPDITDVEAEAVLQVLKSGRLSIGPCIEAFERRIADFVGSRNAIGVSSGTAGLHMAMIVAGVRLGDYVITTPFSFVASANCILYERAVPVFIDVDSASGNIDSERARQAIEDIAQGGERARDWLPRSHRDHRIQGRLAAAIPVHVYGQPAEMDPLLLTARKHGLRVVEDACEALGSEYQGRRAGSLADAGVFGFYPNKQITTGEGGMIVTDNDEWADLFRSLRNQGRDKFDAWLDHSRLGYNYRLDELSAALGVVQMNRAEQLLAKREQVARWYNTHLSDVEYVQLPYLGPTTTRMSWFVYVIRLADRLDRAHVIKRLEAMGVPSRVYFPPIHLQPFYVRSFGYREGDYPIAERLARCSLALPFHPGMTEEQVEFASSALRTVVRDRNSILAAATV
jgi:perosamine synthetase